jgi:hypothetical protein
MPLENWEGRNVAVETAYDRALRGWRVSSGDRPLGNMATVCVTPLDYHQPDRFPFRTLDARRASGRRNFQKHFQAASLDCRSY